MNEENLRKMDDIKIYEMKDSIRIEIKEDREEQFYKELVENIRDYNGKLTISNGIVGSASKEEFLRGEQIIEDVVSKVRPEWTKKQKAAYIHYQMGKLVSYVPDFNYRGKYINAPIASDSRNIWKSIINGESVCNGVSAIMRNLLSRVGIKTQTLSSGIHTFVLAEIEEGNIIIDPTWDLSSTLYEARPNYFGKTYEQLRQIDGEFSNAHKLTALPENVVEITDEELREIYHSLGYTKEDRKFIFPILDETNEINSKQYNNMEGKLNAFFAMFTKRFQKEASHLTETRTILESCMYELGIEPKDLTTKFVYDKSDEECAKPYLSMFIRDENMMNQLRVLDVDKMKFDCMPIEEFDQKYKTHDLDTTEPVWKKYMEKDEIQKEDLEK